MGYQRHYSEEGFLNWVRRWVGRAGRALLLVAFELYYAATSDETPMWAKTVSMGALGYLVLPFDALMDPVLHDDFAVMTTALVAIGRYVTPEIKAKARMKVDELLGPDGDTPVAA